MVIELEAWIWSPCNGWIIDFCAAVAPDSDTMDESLANASIRWRTWIPSMTLLACSRIEAIGHRQHALRLNRLKFYYDGSAKSWWLISVQVQVQVQLEVGVLAIQLESTLKLDGIVSNTSQASWCVFVFIGILAVCRVVIRNNFPHRLLSHLSPQIPESWT